MPPGSDTFVPLRPKAHATDPARLAASKTAQNFRIRLLYRCEDDSAGDYFARMTPIGLGYVNATLRAAGYDSAIGNLSAKSWKEIRAWLKHEQPDVVGITVYTFNRFVSWKLAKVAKEVAPNCLVIVGGPHVTPLASTVLDSHPEIDIVALGEGEQTALDFADAVRTGRPYSSVQGIVYRDGSMPTATIPRTPVEDLDTLPHPSRHYESFGVDRAAQLQYILTSRGCPAACTFCDSPMFWGRAVRYRSAEDVVRELKFLRDEIGLIYVSFRDDTFTADAKRSQEICEAIREANLYLLWDCQSRVNCIDEPRLQALRRAGCGHIQYGVESGSQRILRLLAKGISVERVKKAIDDSRKVGVIPSIYIITGVPGEDESDVSETINVLEEIRANDGIVSRLSVYPGTGVWDEYAKAHSLRDEFWETDKRGSVWAREDAFGPRAQKKLVSTIQRIGAKTRFTPKDFAAHREVGGDAFPTDLHEGWYFEEHGKFEAAAAVYASLRKREPKNFWGWLRTGNVLRKQDRPDEAIRAYDRVAELVPKYAGAHTVIGKAHLEAGRPADARRAFEAALARDPDDLDAKDGIATADRSRGRPSMATRQGKDRTASFEPPTC